MRAIGVANQKGGVAKTTTAKETAVLLASQGWRVIAIDLDGQHDLTNFFLDGERAPATVTDALEGDVGAAEAIVETDRDGLDLMPADDRAYMLASADVRAEAVAAMLDEIAPRYDFAVIDFPRLVSQATIAALMACDVLVVPTEASRASAEATQATLETLEGIGGGVVPSVLLTRYNGRTNITKTYERLIRDVAEAHGARVYGARISLATAVPEAEGYGLTLAEHKATSRPALDYRDYLMELLAGLAMG